MSDAPTVTMYKAGTREVIPTYGAAGNVQEAPMPATWDVQTQSWVLPEMYCAPE